MVAKHCFKVGMYWQGLTHDLSKYSPSEFWQGCKYYQGYRSPNNAEREDKGLMCQKCPACSSCSTSASEMDV